MVQWFQEVLLDVIVQCVFDISQLLHCFTGFNERRAYHRQIHPHPAITDKFK